MKRSAAPALTAVPRIASPFCAKCSQPFAGAISDTFTCANCEGRALHFDLAVSLYRSRGIVREIVHDFRSNRRLHLRRLLGCWIAEALDDSRLASRRFDLVVPVPLHPARKRERGFNQAELLAREMSRSRGLSLGTCSIVSATPPHKRSSIVSERMENLKGAFRLRRGCDVQGLRMLLVDDVLTTGSTLSECASVLKKAGAHSVHAVTAARG